MKPTDTTPADTAQHTPGPWYLSPDGQQILADDCGVDSNEECTAVVADVHGAACADQEGAANARLIAAAPELLAALVEMRNFVQALAGDVVLPSAFQYRGCAAMKATERAIAAAKGGAA